MFFSDLWTKLYCERRGHEGGGQTERCLPQGHLKGTHRQRCFWSLDLVIYVCTLKLALKRSLRISLNGER